VGPSKARGPRPWPNWPMRKNVPANDYKCYVTINGQSENFLIGDSGQKRRENVNFWDAKLVSIFMRVGSVVRRRDFYDVFFVVLSSVCHFGKKAWRGFPCVVCSITE